MLSIFQKPIKNGRCIKRSPRNERKKLYPIHMKNGKELNVNWICETRWNEIKIWNFLFYRNEGMVQMGWLNAFAKHRLSNTFSANSRHFTFPPDLRVLFEIQCHVPPWQLVFTPFLFLSLFFVRVWKTNQNTFWCVRLFICTESGKCIAKERKKGWTLNCEWQQK